MVLKTYVDYTTEEVKTNLAKQQLNFNDGLAKLGLTSPVK